MAINTEPRIECAYDELIETDKLVPNPRNPNKHPQKQLDLLAKIIQHQGWRNPIVVSTRSGFITKGHARLDAAKMIGCEKCPVDYQDYESEASEWADMIADNRLAELAEPSLPELKDLLEELDTGAFDMDLTGFDTEALEDLMTQVFTPKEGLTDDDEIPEKVETICKTGELWQLGNHRLLCGDATKKEDVERLMGGERADMVFTDPPYGANISGMMLTVHGQHSPINRTRWWEQIHGDEHEDANLQSFLETAFANIRQVSNPDAAWYIWHAMLTQGFFAAAAAAAALILHRQIIWVKPALILAFGHYHWRHELCFYGWQKGHEPKFYGGSNANTVWEFDYDGKGRMPSKERKHPTQKPVCLAERALDFSSLVNHSIIDLFGGSGTTLIACEKLNRKCYMMEIDEHYCDVIIQRWQNYTGREAVKLD